MGDEWKPLVYSLIIILGIAGILVLMVDEFDEPLPEPQGVTGFFYSQVNDGLDINITLPSFIPDITFNYNFFDAVLGETGKEYLANSFLVWGIIPDIILIPLFIILSVAIAYSIISLISQFIP